MSGHDTKASSDPNGFVMECGLLVCVARFLCCLNGFHDLSENITIETKLLFEARCAMDCAYLFGSMGCATH